MVINMMANLKIISHMVREFIPGLMARFTKASGKVDLRKGKVFGKVYLAILTLVNGHKARQTGTVCINGRTVIDMKASGNFV